MILKILSVFALLLLIALAAGRGIILRKRGINAFVFGVTDKSDFILMPIVVFFFYTILACAFALPMPSILIATLFESRFINWIGIILCGASLIWFATTLKSFGNSFRVGIDKDAPDRLVTTGMFAISRNPIYVAFLAFFVGMFLVYPNISIIVVFILFFAAIHRQILREEKFLRSHYGQEYEEYYQNVRRYL